ncbi:MAG: hypothetical protein ACD_61C00071G0009 [uncultured bacterium]|nr:MAG: hypothetical protein ACD_61C00071G0009 [uncultured bacterium]
MMRKNHYKIIFWLIIGVIVFFTQFYKLTSYPPSLSIDEVSIGYNAYSILKTGRDEWGSFLPISFKSVGDYKAPVLIYVTVPFIKLFGLTELGTRLPVAVFSALNVFLFWILISRFIFSNKSAELSYLATFIFTLSPWLVPFSRSGFEAITALSFLLLNLIFTFRWRRSEKISDFFLMVIFAYFSAITYHSTKIVVPLLNLFIIFANYRFFKSSITSWYSNKKNSLFFISFALFFITVFFVKNFILGSGGTRAGMTLLTKDYDYTNGILPFISGHPLSWLTSAVGLISFWYKRFLEYFSPNFYLSDGLGLATPGHPGQGVIYMIEYPFLIIGSLLLFFRHKFVTDYLSGKFTANVLAVWFFIALIPASITNNSQHALRTLNIVPVFSILISLGMLFVYGKFKNTFWKSLLAVVVVGGYLLGILRFVDYYTLHYPIELSEARSYGWKQMAIYARNHHSEYEKVYIDPRFGTDGPYTYGVPYLYFLFYSQYDPSSYNTGSVRNTGGTDFENYFFGPINWPDIDHTRNNLYISSPWSIPKELIDSQNQKAYAPFLNNSSGLYAISDR